MNITNKSSSKVIRSNTTSKVPPATVKEAVQKRIIPEDHSSIIPGIDVNELKHSLDLMKYALDYSEAIVDTVRLPLVILSKNLQVLTANRSFYETFRLSPQETENQSIYKLNENAWKIPKLKVLLEKILPTNTTFDNYEVQIDLPHLGKRTLLMNARRTYRQVNNTEAILLAFEDITDRKLLDDQKNDFIGIVSHELKTPLTSIKAFSQLLNRHLKKNSDKKGELYLSKMTNQMERLTQLMASFVNVYRIQNRKLSLHKKYFDINDMISTIISDFSYTTKSHIVEFNSQSRMKVFADKERIMQVIINLLSNAIKYSPDAHKIIVTSLQEENNIIFSVQDFGFGVPKEEQNKIFDRFFRVKRQSEKNISGLGLGLYISYEIVTLHNGKIWVESEVGKGSTFYFTLPLKNK